MKKLSIFIILISLTINTFAIEKLKKNEGYLLVALNVEKGYLPKYVELSGEGLFSKTIKLDSLQPYLNYWLVRVKSGTYRWEKIFFNKRLYLDIDDSNYDIKVKSGKINYGGHLSLYSEMNSSRNEILGGARLNFNNKSSKALSYLEYEYTELLQNYELVYSGSEKDHFFNFLKTQGVLFSEE